MDNGLCVSGSWLKGNVTPEKAPVTLVLNDQGRKAAASDVSDRVNRDEQVLALDLTVFVDAWKENEQFSSVQFVPGEGDRSLALQAVLLLAVSNSCGARADAHKVRCDRLGLRA